MSWLVWRTHRVALLGVLFYLAVTAALGVATHVANAPCPSLTQAGIEACLHALANSPANTLGMATMGLAAVFPVVVGVFLGAPLVSREISSGTTRLVWTQGVSRWQWLVAQLASLCLVTLAGAAALTVLVPWATRDNPDDLQHFDFLGFAPAAYCLFALLLGVAIGAVTRRVVAGMALTVVAWSAVRLGIFALRPGYMAPVTTTSSLDSGGLILSSHFIDRTGAVIDASVFQGAFRACIDAHSVRGIDALASCGVRVARVVQPADRFWPFQLIEAGIFAALALLALGVLLVVFRRA